MKLDLTDKTQHLTDQEKDFLDYLIGVVKLSEMELRATFGDNYDRLTNKLELHRIAGEVKRDRAKRKNLVDEFKLVEYTKLIPLAIKTLYDVMKTGKEHNRVTCAIHLAKLPASYLERYGIKMAEIESVLDLNPEQKEKVIKLDFQDKGL